MSSGSRPDRLVLATSNRGKLADFRLLFEGAGIELDLPGDHGVSLDVEETGLTFEDNARLKARACMEATGMVCLADDSGIIAYALGEEPGVVSARYAGPDCDDHENNMKLIARLAGNEDRRAAFVCSLVLVWPDGHELTSEGRCEGEVIDEERGENGFGYDSVFYRADLGRTFGQSSAREKNERSHRGAAVRSLLDRLCCKQAWAGRESG